ncbi:MAG: hypothetical protein P0S93_01530 [Candidatus Neptunochlamydia sp.]|nr:hypothetical protein [Candidatus Neptunochlamydia sp.]
MIPPTTAAAELPPTPSVAMARATTPTTTAPAINDFLCFLHQWPK